MSDWNILIEYLTSNMDQLVYSSSSSLSFDFPNFELMPFDYLEFAEQDLAVGSTLSKIGCVSNLKRATECEMDTLLHVLGLTGKYKNFVKKLDFIAQAGLLSPRSLEKLNKIRNKMEHEYAIPDLDELETYFDLASGFVHSLEGYIFMLITHAEQEWCRVDAMDYRAFGVCLSAEPAEVCFSIYLPEGTKKLNFSIANGYSEYTKALKAFFLISRAIRLVSPDYVVAKLTSSPLTIKSGRGSNW